eukprot:gene25458-32738_t
MVPEQRAETVMTPRRERRRRMEQYTEDERVETVMVPGTVETTVTVGGWCHGRSTHHNKNVAELRSLYSAHHAS